MLAKSVVAIQACLLLTQVRSECSTVAASGLVNRRHILGRETGGGRKPRRWTGISRLTFGCIQTRRGDINIMRVALPQTNYMEGAAVQNPRHCRHRRI